MNVYRRELRAHRKSLFFWCLAMIFLVASSMAKFAAYQKSGQSIAGLIKQLPHTVQVIFGTDGFNLSTVKGYFGVAFLYFIIMAAVHAALLGAELITKEERDRTAEFLFSRPISRGSVIRAKLLAGLTQLVVFNLVTLFSSLYFVHYFAKQQNISSYILLLMAGLFILQLVYFSLGSAIAAIVRRPKTAAPITTSVLLVTLLLMFFINLSNRLGFLRYFTPFKYFDAKSLQYNGLDPVFIAISTVLVISAILIADRAYAKRDLSV